MTSIPFEEPQKAEMRERCEVAIDQAGYTQVANPLPVALPAELGLKGSLRGDLQSLDNDGARYCFYLRPRANSVLPKWLINLAGAAHKLPSVKLYVVAGGEPAPEFEKSCKMAGAGLLTLTTDDSFHLLLNFDETLPAEVEAAFADKVTNLRRSMETKLQLRQGALQSNLEHVSELTAGMAQDVADSYVQSVERGYGLWTSWSENISTRLDAAFGARDLQSLELLERDIESGPLLDADV